MNAPILCRGIWTVRALARGSRCFAEDYLRSLPEKEQQKLFALLDYTAQHGPPTNTEKFKQLEGEIYEFKSLRHRLLCFYQPGKVIVITHGCRKQRRRVHRDEINRATDLMQEYLETEVVKHARR